MPLEKMFLDRVGSRNLGVQLTLLQPRGQIMSTTLLLASPDQTIHPRENFEPMNFLQMSCVITWAQKKFSLQPQKNK